MQKKVLITAALSEIGVALSQAYREKGYYVFGLGLEEDYHNYCNRFFRFDLNRFVKDADYRIKFTAIFDEVIPKLDVLLNNSTFQPSAKLENIKLEDWQHAMNVNLTGPMLLSKLFLKRLKESNGCILNIGGSQKDRLQADLLISNCFNSALIGFTQALAVDLKGLVRSNAVNLLESTTDHTSEDIFPDEGNGDEFEDKDREERPIQFEEVTKMALFLASEDAKFLTGRNFVIEP